ncbi:MAG TPA: hypothetical protein VIN67_08000, partial [Desulfobaccales bacterium]
NGTISPSGAVTVNPGSSQLFVITPAAGYHVASILVDGAPVGMLNSYTFTSVNASHTINATFVSGHTTTLLFDQSAYPGDVWLQIQDPINDFQATYANGTKSFDFTYNGNKVEYSAPVKLSDIGAGGLEMTYGISAGFFVYYDDPTGISRTIGPDYHTTIQRFMPLEMTMTGGSGDQGDVTAINWFSAPLGIRSYANNPFTNSGEPVLQQTGFKASAAAIGAQLALASGNNSLAVVKDAHGNIIRYIGPSSYNGTNPWPSFIPYTKSINKAGQSTIIQSNPQGFYFNADPTPVYNFGSNMTATANADGSLTVTGAITATMTGTIKPGNPALPTGGQWTNATISFSVSDPDAFNNAIYGQNPNSATPTSGTGWTNFQSFLQNTLLDPTKPHDPTTNPSLFDTGAAQAPPYNTAYVNFVGEVSTGLLGGFFNSSVASNYPPDNGAALKNVPSNHWWLQNPIMAFSEIQPVLPYYNIYAETIFNESHNTVYGVPFSDRFGKGPLVNSVIYNGKNVNYWVIGVGAPLPSSIPPPGMPLLLGN